VGVLIGFGRGSAIHILCAARVRFIYEPNDLHPAALPNLVSAHGRMEILRLKFGTILWQMLCASRRRAFGPERDSELSRPILQSHEICHGQGNGVPVAAERVLDLVLQPFGGIGTMCRATARAAPAVYRPRLGWQGKWVTIELEFVGKSRRPAAEEADRGHKSSA